MRTEQVKFQAGSVRVPVTLIYRDDRIYLQFGFNRTLINEIKNMEGRKWHGFDDPPRKVWSIPDTARNRFSMEFLQGRNPYAHWENPLETCDFKRPLREHQKEFTDFMLTRRQCILAGEMGTGKTLSAIEVMERSRSKSFWYVAPKSALRAVHLEFNKWKLSWRPRTMTYEGLTKTIKEWAPGQSAPFGVIFDESARLKNPTSQRSQAAKHLAEAIRAEYGLEGFVILMSGAPAPKSPADWWHQCEIACPGFLKEGHIAAFKQRLAIIVQQESITGGSFPHIVTWRDDENKCDKCGQPKENHICTLDDECVGFEPSVNEVEALGRRMSGLVLKRLKKECLELPDKQYRQIQVEPTQKILNLAQGIVDRARNTITAITQLRMLSDGFMYCEEKTGEKICPACHGNENERPTINEQRYCDVCNNAGVVETFKRKTHQLECPKEQVIIDLLDEHIDIGRIGIYAGFTGSIDRLVAICQKGGWETVRADGRGWKTSFDGDALDVFQNGQSSTERVAFIGQPGAAGTGLTLTASPTGTYYSNDFDADHRIQSEDRFHRLGMDENRGCTIIDIFHLPTDELVYNNLKAKREMQAMTIEQIRGVFK